MKGKTTEGAKASRQARSALIIGLFILFLTGQSYGQENIDLEAMIQETQKMSRAPDEMTLVWWLPEQFWQASMAQDPTVTKAQVDQFLETIRPYTMIAVVDGRIGAFGGVTYKSEEAVRTSVKIKDDKGWSYTPLSESEVDPDTKNLLQILKPIIANLLGPMGQNMHFILFQSKTKDGRSIADATGEGMLNIVVAEKEFKYRLPLGSVLPPKYDPKTGEKFPGNYTYNPFTGSKLVSEPSNKPLQPTR
jgi:hypothetical protein